MYACGDTRTGVTGRGNEVGGKNLLTRLSATTATTIKQAVSFLPRKRSRVLPVATAVRGDGHGNSPPSPLPFPPFSFHSLAFPYATFAVCFDDRQRGLISRVVTMQKLFYVCCSCGTIFQ